MFYLASVVCDGSWFSFLSPVIYFRLLWKQKMLQRHKGRNYEGFQSSFLIRYFLSRKDSFSLSRCKASDWGQARKQCKDGKINFRVSSDSLLSAILIMSCFQMNSRFITAGVAFNYGWRGMEKYANWSTRQWKFSSFAGKLGERLWIWFAFFHHFLTTRKKM